MYIIENPLLYWSHVCQVLQESEEGNTVITHIISLTLPDHSPLPTWHFFSSLCVFVSVIIQDVFLLSFFFAFLHLFFNSCFTIFLFPFLFPFLPTYISSLLRSPSLPSSLFSACLPTYLTYLPHRPLSLPPTSILHQHHYNQLFIPVMTTFPLLHTHHILTSPSPSPISTFLSFSLFSSSQFFSTSKVSPLPLVFFPLCTLLSNFSFLLSINTSILLFHYKTFSVTIHL